jgi:hypothetical protein
MCLTVYSLYDFSEYFVPYTAFLYNTRTPCNDTAVRALLLKAKKKKKKRKTKLQKKIKVKGMTLPGL